ncbi:hypothetical protein [Aeromonas veronii]|uniref:hypothetical protein n=1 Tax=Aeromonas veronii TaxID=654 RepID=UPI0024419576|nr:hypothetical protein [Aeromonas veronii]
MEKILAKCEHADLEYLSSVLDSYVSFTDDAARNELLQKKSSRIFSQNGTVRTNWI